MRNRNALTRITESQFLRMYSARERMAIAETVTGDDAADFESTLVTETLHAMADCGETDMQAFFNGILRTCGLD